MKNSSKINKTNEIRQSEINTTDIKATEVQPTKIEATKIEPTNIQPTDINATEIKPSDIKPTDNIVATNNKQVINDQYKKTNSILMFSAFVLFSLLTCIVWLTQGWQTYLLAGVFCSVFALVFFIKELNKMQITQAEIDEWNKKLPANNQLKLDDFKKLSNKFSFWVHKLKNPVVKVVSCVVIAGVCALWIATPILNITGIAGVSSVEGNSYAYSSYEYTFESDNTYVQKYEGSTMDSGTWSQSGNKLTCHSNGGITIIFTVSSSYIKSTDGNIWQRQ